MCGRYSLQTAAQVLMDRFNIEMEEDIKPRYNIAPRQKVPIVTAEEPNKAVMASWGFIPHWSDSKTFKYSTINARSDRVHKGMFKHAFEKKRCWVLADGFYEWQETKDGKIPYRITLENEVPFAFAGLYDYATHEDKDSITFTIVTTDANEQLKPVHDRMPVILPKKYEKDWLDSEDLEHLQNDILIPYPDELEMYQLSKLINSPKNENPDVIKPAKEQQQSFDHKY